MLKEQLEKIGMADKEAKVFLASLELGSSSVQEIAKKSYFQTEDPKRLLKLLEEQEEGLRRKEEEFKKYLPELETLFNIAEEKPKVRFFEGKEGLITIREDYFRAKDKEVAGFFA